MSDTVVNLRQAKKRLARAAKEKTAEENRQRYGRTKQDKTATQNETVRRDKKLDGHRLDDDPDNEGDEPS
ncbi:MAG: DUF4169 family protein [Devosiaceae bacterium]|nr:DUF4169 family protein [Devosiaceae bacterium MH13]